MTSENEYNPTPAAEWRKPREEGYTVTLLSGNRATLRPVALDVLIASGELPDVLTPIAAQSLWQDRETQDIAEAGDVAKQYADLVNAVVPAAFLYPQVVEDPQGEDEISLDDIDFQDKVQVFNLATAGAMFLRKFREKQSRDVEAEQDGEDDGNAAQSPAAD